MREGLLLVPTPLSSFDPQQRSFQSILAGTQFSLPFKRQNIFIHFCFQLYDREGKPELPQFKLREADGEGQDFLQSHKLLLQTLGQKMSQEITTDHV